MVYKDPNLMKPTGEKDGHGFPVDSCAYCVLGSKRFFAIHMGRPIPEKCLVKTRPRKGNCLPEEKCKNWEDGGPQFKE